MSALSVGLCDMVEQGCVVGQGAHVSVSGQRVIVAHGSWVVIAGLVGQVGHGSCVGQDTDGHDGHGS